MIPRLSSLVFAMLALAVLVPAASAQQTCADLTITLSGSLSTGGSATFTRWSPGNKMPSRKKQRA